MMEKTGKIILFTSAMYPCKIGGMEIYNYHLVRELAKRKEAKHMTVLSSCPVAIDGMTILPEKERVFISRKFGLSTASTILYYWFSNKFRWKDVKVVYVPYTSNFSFSAFPYLILKKLLNVDYVVHMHSGGGRDTNPRWLLNKFFKHARGIAGVSHPIVNEYKEKTGREIKYLPPLLPFEASRKDKQSLRKAKGFDRFKKIILYVGSIKQIKSPETLIKAYLELGENFVSNQGLGLILVGQGRLLAQLENRYGKGKNIVFTGAVPNEEIKDYYRMADIYAITSWFEGTPISLMEAMFNKLPCIGSNVSGIQDIITSGQNGYLFEKENHVELSRVIKEVVINEDDAIQKGEKAYQDYLRRFNYDDHLTDVINFINGIE